MGDLPALHEIYFSGVALLKIRDWGWRVELTKAPGTENAQMVLELRLDRANARYCVRTLTGPAAGTEIWTILEPLEPQRTAVGVRFCLPEGRPEKVGELRERYRSSHARLWDQDEAMMRREALSTREKTQSKPGSTPIAPRPLCELRKRLPLLVEFDASGLVPAPTGAAIDWHRRLG